MEFMDVVHKRRSIRRYKPDPIPEEKLRAVLEAARLAPSWGNRQCWKYIIVTDENLKKKITMRDWAAQAPIVIVGCADPSKSGNKFEQTYYMLDMGISMEHLMLAAAEQGLGTCWIGGQYEESVIKQTLGIPQEFRVVALTPLGFPDEAPEPRTRKSLDEISSRNKWQGV